MRKVTEYSIVLNQNNGEIILYQTDNSIRLEVRLYEETVWLNRTQLPILLDRDIKTIGKHINNALQEELSDCPVVAKFATVQKEGNCLHQGKRIFWELVKFLPFQQNCIVKY